MARSPRRTGALNGPTWPMHWNSSIESMEPMEPLSSGHESAITQHETIDTKIDQSGVGETSCEWRSNRVRMMNRRNQYCIRVGSPLLGSGSLQACPDRALSPRDAITCLLPRRLLMSPRLRLSLLGSLPSSGLFWAILTNFDQAQPWPTCAPLESLDPSRRSTLTSLSTPHLRLSAPIMTNFDQL